MIGGYGPQLLYGDQGNDTVLGKWGDDVLFGGGSSDRLNLVHVGGDAWRLEYLDSTMTPRSETFTVAGVTELTAGVDYEFV